MECEDMWWDGIGSLGGYVVGSWDGREDMWWDGSLGAQVDKRQEH